MTEKTRVAAYGLIVDGDRILLCRAAEKTDAYGKWTLPGGGINFGEPPVDGMIREVEEETGLIVTSAGLVTVDSLVSHWEGTTYHHVRVIYLAKVIGGELRHEINGSTDFASGGARTSAPISESWRRLEFGWRFHRSHLAPPR
jgi:8-oxo-dGTP diphosphatase